MQQPAQCHYHQVFHNRHTLKCVVFKSLAFVLFSECKIRVKTRNKNIFFGRFHIFTNSTPTTDILEKHKTTRATQTPSLCAKEEFQRWNRRKSPLKMWKITADAYFLQAVVSGNHRLTSPPFSHGRTENTHFGSTEKAENQRKYRKPSGEHRTYAFPNIRTVRHPKAAEEATAHVRPWEQSAGRWARGGDIYLHCFMKHSP